MAIDRISLLELYVRVKMKEISIFLREAMRVLVQSLMEAEVAARYERNAERVNQLNGYRERGWRHWV